MLKKIRLFLGLLIFAVLFFFGVYSWRIAQENKVLNEIITRLQADSRIAEVVVTAVKADPKSGKTLTTIKFLEYGAIGQPLEPKYFTFSGNIIQFQSLVIRFNDIYVRNADKFRGKSAYIFWKVFRLDGPNTEEYEINRVNDIPDGYRVGAAKNNFEQRLWEGFWKYALDARSAKGAGVKNAQVEAPGTRFIPGLIYTLKIEHDGGIRIDSAPVPRILKDELR